MVLLQAGDVNPKQKVAALEFLVCVLSLSLGVCVCMFVCLCVYVCVFCLASRILSDKMRRLPFANGAHSMKGK